MRKILISQIGCERNPFEALVSFGGGSEYPVIVTDPFSQEDEKRLEWYFEHYCKCHPDEKAEAEKAEKTAQSISDYGEHLFEQIFIRDPKIYAEYKHCKDRKEPLKFEIAGDPQFHALHWETLKEPDPLCKPCALSAQMVRKNLEPQSGRAEIEKPPSVINLLIVTARRAARKEINTRSVTLPVVKKLRQSRVRVNIRILRPGTFDALRNHLADKGRGHYHIIHLDMHGSVLTYEDLQKGFQADPSGMSGYGGPAVRYYEDSRAFLFMESTGKNSSYDPVAAEKLAELLNGYQIPVAVLNACQSAGHTGKDGISLGACLIKAGVQTVLGIGYSMMADGATLMMTHLYEKLFDKKSLSKGILAREELYYNRKRKVCRYQTFLELEDWMLPIVWENREVNLTVRELTPDESRIYFERKAGAYPFPKTDYDFAERDYDIQETERRILSCNLLFGVWTGGCRKNRSASASRCMVAGNRVCGSGFLFQL
ncbi:MAG: hypothetical protein DRI57_25370 [Deltaproteobacteria bacterium]|nr:MAG: hypothetical protein DRI57_25370 [Deltaproteobacteria bacterium]